MTDKTSTKLRDDLRQGTVEDILRDHGDEYLTLKGAAPMVNN